MSVEYLAACAVATAAAVALALRLPAARSGRRWAGAHATLAVLFVAAAMGTQQSLARLEGAWPAVSADIASASAAELQAAVAALAGELRQAAARALAAPRDPPRAFAALRGVPSGDEERATILYRNGAPEAWGGRVRLAPDSLTAPAAVVRGTFYTVLAVGEVRGDRRALATAVLHAEPPGDRLARATDASVARRTGVRGFDLRDRPAGPAFRPIAVGPETLLWARPEPVTEAEVRLRIVEQALMRGIVLLAAALAAFIVAVWRAARGAAGRFAALVVAVGALAVVPLNAFSNQARLFDPALYFAPLGGPLTASAGALALTSGLMLLGLLTVERARGRRPPRWAATVTVLLLAGLGPFLLRDLARGIATPSYGVSPRLWLTWQVPLFLAATTVLLAVAMAGRVALAPRRRLPVYLAPVLAAVAAVLAPVTWEAPGRLPDWYAPLWIAALAAVAFTRRHRGTILTTATVAGLGATVLVWAATARQRVVLAERDARGLALLDPYAATLLRRLSDGLAGDAPPAGREDLLRRYVTSDLAAARYPTALAAWDHRDSLVAELRVADVAATPEALAAARADARAAGAAVVRDELGELTRRLVLAVPHPDGRLTTVVVAPRTRLIPDDPFAPLLGIAPDPAGETPYALALAGRATPDADTGGRGRWTRQGGELHGDWVVPGRSGANRVHAEVELRSLAALVPRGALILVFDLAIVAAIWLVSALSDEGTVRWLARRQRAWTRSFRARLTLALTAFFVIPAAAFAAWSYGQIRSGAERSQELLAGETLRAARPSTDAATLARESARFETPLLVYRAGRLDAASDPLLRALAPLGQLLRPDVELPVGLAAEVTASRVETVGSSRLLVGYRGTTTEDGARVVLAAPARPAEEALERRREDLSVLLLVATALGALAAFWLGGVAARQLARPIRELREAALAVAGGEREPALEARPPSEFQPVFAAFRRMAADLRESEAALEEAQRRTAAVLRNVASGVAGVSSAERVTIANPRADALLGVRLPPGTPLDAIPAAELVARVRAFLGGRRDEEEFELDVGGRQLHGRLTRLGGGGAVLTVDDVTEIARAQRVLAWGAMARQVAHEIKNPLTPIRLGVQHLRRARSDPRADFDAVLEQNVARILAEIDRLDEIARTFSRYGTAPADRAPAEPVDAAAVARSVVDLETMGPGEVEWRIAGEASAPAMARAAELREVLLNVLENARLANARMVTVAVERRDGRVLIAVEDDGEGIPEDVLPRVFEPHFSTRTSGSGLGLAVSRRLVDGWGGAMRVASRRGAGTRVEIDLRAVDARGEAPPPGDGL